MEPITRRQALRAAALAAGGVSVVGAGAVRARAATAELPPPFSVPFVVPETLSPVRRDASTDYYEMAIRAGLADVLPGHPTPIWGYDGRWPGPTIRAIRGRRVVVRQRNQLRVPVAVHLHGAHVAAADDGHPLDLIPPGGVRDYHYPNDQPAGTLWYHDHVHHRTSRNVYRGLAGLYLLHDPREAALGLPGGQFDIPLLLQDRSFQADGSLAFRDDHFSVLGDLMMVNGRPQPRFEVAARRYRLRLVNASNSRAYRLRLDSGQPVVQVAADAALLPAPRRTEAVELWPAQRADVIVDFSPHAAGARVVLENTAGSGRTAQVMRFDVTGPAPDPSRIPRRLRALPPLPRAPETRTVVLGLDQHGHWVFNRRRFDPRRVDARVRRGRTQVWRLVNRTTMAHPIHFHNQSFRVVDRDGRPPGPAEAGTRDTVIVAPGETVRILLRFERYLGRYVYHCHQLPHEDHDMMAQLEVVP